MKKILVLLLIGIPVLLVSCNMNNDSRIISKLEKTLEKYRGYTAEVNMRTIIDDKESNYKMEENFSIEDKYSLKIIEPEESKGIIIKYEDDKLFIQHASIDQSISLSNVKTFNKGLILGGYLYDLNSIESIDRDEIDEVEYYIFTNRIEDKNKYTEKAKIWLRKKDFKPYMLNIIDKDENPRVIIRYDNFNFIK